jgi:hypothetical protein
MTTVLLRFVVPCLTLVGGCLRAQAVASPVDEPIDIGSRRELFADGFLVDRLTGGAALRLHQPVPREIVIVHDAPWEGSGSGYHSIFKDGDRYRMYYKSYQIDPLREAKLPNPKPPHPLLCAYAESDDGIRWRKPELGLFEFQGSKANNIVMAAIKVGNSKINAAHPAVFKDENPAAPADARYKALFPVSNPKGLVALKSPDGLHWQPLSEKPVITDGWFDSQNLAFWDGVRGEYRAYWRFFTGGTPEDRLKGDTGRSTRGIRTAVSKDFLVWAQQKDLRYGDVPEEHLYTNQIKPYHRAPHLLVGFPLRYLDRGWSDSMRALPELAHRESRSAARPRYGTALTEGLFMASRDGVNFKRWDEAFLPPGIEREGTWNYGHQTIAWHLVETKSALEGAPDELSLYAVESYWTGNSSALRRYTLRMDGFVSVRAPMSGGEVVTKPLRFQGLRLALNFATSAAGDLRVEIQDATGRPLPGFALDDCPAIFGDTLDRPIAWKSGRTLESLAGTPVRLRFSLRDADLYAFRFIE